MNTKGVPQQNLPVVLCNGVKINGYPFVETRKKMTGSTHRAIPVLEYSPGSREGNKFEDLMHCLVNPSQKLLKVADLFVEAILNDRL